MHAAAMLPPQCRSTPRRCTMPRDGIGYAIADWRRLRQSNGYRFADYARFLVANPGWPGESAHAQDAPRRRCAAARTPRPRARLLRRRQADAAATAGRGSPRLTLATGKPTEALAAARKAWTSADLDSNDESAIWPARRPASPPPTMTGGSMPCCSARRPPTRRAADCHGRAPSAAPPLTARLAMQQHRAGRRRPLRR